MVSKRLILYSQSNFSEKKIDHIVSVDKVIGFFSGGVSVMLITSKLCSVRAYSQYAFGVP